MAYSETRFVRPDRRWPSEAAQAAVIALSMVTAASGYVIYQTNIRPPSTPPLPSAHVKVSTETGHGSATHIGDGLYVTAAHVVDGQSEITINGAPVAVLWSNKEYDIALMRGSADAAFVPLACVTPQVGDVGQAHGNPLVFEDITTTLIVAGEVGTIGDWKSATPMDGTMGPGMSGGGFVMGGHVAGVNVGVALAPASGFPSYFGISIIVPAQVVCDLMGRS